ncbi:restriction endonuclease subunit S [Actinomadura sp. 9N407]|uniref:restriction endonuclease subunit S n=1 Tax=Actinomadura sp. 9N407 TaxID=3375154 RepID=UPI003788010A
MSELPYAWTWATIGEICAINPRQFSEPIADDELLSKVPMAAVQAETGKMDGTQIVRYADIKKKTLTPFQEGDVLFAKVTPCMENGKIALATRLHGGRGVGSTEFFVLRSRGNVDPRYMMYFLLQQGVRSEAERSMTGAVGLRRVPRPYLENLKIPIPPMPEQRRITAAVEDHLSRLDAGLDGVDRAKRQVPVLWEALLRQAVDGELSQVADADAADYSTGQIKEARRKMARNSRRPAAPAPISDYSLPAGWRLASLDEISYASGYGTSTKCDYGGLGAPVLRIPNIRSGEIEFSDQKNAVDATLDLSRLFVTPGDLLFIRTNGSLNLLGRAAVVREASDTAFASYLIRYRLLSEVVIPDWVRLVVDSPKWRHYIMDHAASSAGQYNVNLKVLGAMPIPIPPLEQQRRILEDLKSQQTLVARFEVSTQQSIERASSLREAVLRGAFSGKLVPQDSTDRPASVLLERIQAKQTAVRQGSRRRHKGAAAPSQEELPL